MANSPCYSIPVAALGQNVQAVPGTTATRLSQLLRLGIETVGDLLFHLPREHEDLSDVRPIAALTEGSVQTVYGEVVEIEGRRLNDGRCIVSVVIEEGGQCLEGAWFNQAHAAARFHYGQRVAFTGKPKWYRDHWQMSSPRVRVLDINTEDSPPAGLMPVYPLTEDLRNEHLRKLMRTALNKFGKELLEILPERLREKHQLPAAPQALQDIHFPGALPAAHAARRRFIYEEFLVLQIALALRRRELRDKQRAAPLPVSEALDARIRKLLPFDLTPGQNRAVTELRLDLAGDRPMQRLLQADVGAGKTAVAVYALLTAVANKHQAVLLAPTEVLARQHYRTLDAYLSQSRVRRRLLIGGLPPRERRETLESIHRGDVDLVIGTQALLQEGVQFAKLGLVVIDEQHKFGVNQRARVRQLGAEPHYLVMTATPIPRTVALTVFGDLDVSTIRGLPPGRQPVVTRWLTEVRREATYEDLRQGLQRGEQAYVICPVVEESGTHDLKSAEQTRTELQAGPFRDFRVGLLHGRQEETVKDATMEQFRRKEIDLLVATTVVEVGVDVPNATWMIVEHADRFGLSQLHQLRGRVSRGPVAGRCYLFAEPATEDAAERLKVIARTTDGFELAEHDARLRGLGEFFGTRQHGLGELRFGDLRADYGLLQTARADAFALVAEDPGLARPDHVLLRQAVLNRYGQKLDLSQVG